MSSARFSASWVLKFPGAPPTSQILADLGGQSRCKRGHAVLRRIERLTSESPSVADFAIDVRLGIGGVSFCVREGGEDCGVGVAIYSPWGRVLVLFACEVPREERGSAFERFSSAGVIARPLDEGFDLPDDIDARIGVLPLRDLRGRYPVLPRSLTDDWQNGNDGRGVLRGGWRGGLHRSLRARGASCLLSSPLLSSR
jgi:hypothetical protein